MNQKRKGKILVVYSHQLGYPLRSTIRDHLFAFKKYSGCQIVYLNIAWTKVKRSLLKINFDLIIFHNIFLSKRWGGEYFKFYLERVKLLKLVKCTKIALPQDEFLQTDILCNFLEEFEIEHVFSVSPPTEFSKIYANIDRNKIKLHTILTGYLDESTLKKIRKFEKITKEKDIDICYRVTPGAHWLGRHGFLKTQIGKLFSNLGEKNKLIIDISINEKDTILGDDWYKFLLRSKYTIGVEGGASILDHNGSLKAKTEAYLEQYPNASFEEVESACFPGRDGELQLFVISPRHLEACATKTCQILIEGNYNGLLKPGKHYIPLNKDFSNLDSIIREVKDDVKRKSIIENAYNDIIVNKTVTYQSFVEKILKEVLIPNKIVSTGSRFWLNYFKLIEVINWIKIIFYTKITYLLKEFIKRILPQTIVEKIKTRSFVSRYKSHNIS